MKTFTEPLDKRTVRLSIATALLCLCMAAPLYAQGIDIDLKQFLPLNNTSMQYLNGTKVLALHLYSLEGGLTFKEGSDKRLVAKTKLAILQLSRPDKPSFLSLMNGRQIEVFKYPIVLSDETKDPYLPIARNGRWNFRHGTVNIYEKKVVLGNGMKLDISYQDSRMSTRGVTTKKLANKTVVHYGLYVSKEQKEDVKRFFKDYMGPKSVSNTEAVIAYHPDDDIVIVRFGIDAEGNFYFVPVMDFIVDTELKQ